MDSSTNPHAGPHLVLAGEANPLSPAETAPPQAPTASPRPWWRRWWWVLVVVIGLGVGAYFLVPRIITMLNTVSTDDAYVNGHVTFVAARVPGQVSRVFVDDNDRVKKGDLLVQLDKEPYRVQVGIQEAAVATAEADLTATQDQVRGLAAQVRANRFRLIRAIEAVNDQVAALRANVAAYESRLASLALARANLKRGEELIGSGGISKEDLDQRRQTVKVDEAAVKQALETVHANRVSLGLAAQPPDGEPLTAVPAELNQNFSTVRQNLADLLQSAAQLGLYPTNWAAAPNQAIAEFAPQESADILPRLLARAPQIRQAQGRLEQARRNLDQAELNLRYCDVVAEIDGVIIRRNINPGNNVQTGQSLMAIRSLREIWIDANFKETQLGYLRIGQRARVEVDMYGKRHEFRGRVVGFSDGTGQTLTVLPPENASGNFVKVVQRLPVRIELLDYDPDQQPLFVGLSTMPYVYYKKPPTGSNAGAVLRPYAPVPVRPTEPRP